LEDLRNAGRSLRVAAATGQHAYELLCRIPARVQRRYVVAEETMVRVPPEPSASTRVAI